MSRHQFPGLDGASTVFIGWDRPMQTFFVQVLRPHPHLAGEEETVAWHGTAIGELANAREAVTIASRWASTPVASPDESINRFFDSNRSTPLKAIPVKNRLSNCSSWRSLMRWFAPGSTLSTARK